MPFQTIHRVDFLVNCSGILNPDGKGETSLRGVSQDALRATFDTNALGPLLMIKHFSGMMAVPAKVVCYV
jgi:NAD(P)-dependent dehydrogenase (short-subunit alcohol dehydrogenase family)